MNTKSFRDTIIGFLLCAMPALSGTTVLAQTGFWESLNGPEGGVVQCFAVDNNDDILAGTYLGGVYKTTNRGLSWFQLPYMNLDIRALAVNANGIIFLGAATSGLWKSTDNGTTWVRPTNILNGRTVNSIAFHSSGNVIAACFSTTSQAVFQSTDNGETFFQVSSLILSGNSVIRQGTDMYVAGERNGVLRSTDGGFFWTNINPSSAQFNGHSLTANANYVYVVGRKTAATNPDSAFIYRRSISSGTWELVHIQGSTILRAISSVGDTLMATGDSTVVVSFNGGQNWITRSLGGQNRGPIALYYFARAQAALAERDFQLCGLAGQGVVRSANFFDAWEMSNEGMHNTHIVARPLIWGDEMLISTQFNGRWKYAFTAGSWSPTGDGLPFDVVSSLASDNTYMYAGTVNNGLYRSSDWGETFSQTLFGTNATGFADIETSPSISGFVMASGRGEHVWKSTNFGVTWESNTVPGSPYSVTGISAISQNEFYVATGNFAGYGTGNGVYKTTNGGTSYTHHGLQFNICSTLDRYNNDLLVGNSLDRVLEGNISATSWTGTPSFDAGVRLRDAMFYKYAANQPIREITGTSVGFYEREAFSQDPWVKRVLGGFEVSRFEYVRNGSAATFQGQIMAGTYGGGMYKSTSPLTSVDEGMGMPHEFILHQNYPNPFNPTTAISYQLSAVSHVTLKVYDLLGREAATLVDEEMTPGRYNRVFNAEGLASGVYLYQLRAGAFVQTKKLLLIR